MTITVGTDTYVAVATADTYFAAQVGGDVWTNLDNTLKEQLLVSATRMIDRQTWAGVKTVSAQALQWPRTGVVDRYGNAIDSATVPQQIKDAECELALAINANPTVITNTGTGTNVKFLRAGTAEIAYFRPLKGGRFPTVIQELVGQFLGGAASQAGPVVSGSDQRSSFDPCNPNNNFNFNNGFS